MDPIAGLFILVVILLIFFLPLVLGIIAMVRASALGRRVEDLERFDAGRSARVLELRKRIEELERGGKPAAPAPPPEPVAPPPPAVVAPPPPLPEPARPVPRVLPPPIPAAISSEPPPFLAPLEPYEEKPAREAVPLENLIGERILPRLGVVALVLGLALLLWYAVANLGAAGKIALAGTSGVLMVAGGAFFRRRDSTKLLGGCLIGGGWAVVYSTAFAAHFVEVSRIINSPLLGFLLLVGVALAALAHALRYKSETIAGLAYLLIFVTLFLSPEPGPPAWLAMGLSGAGLIVLAWRAKWIRLCAVGAAVVYAAEIFWLHQTPRGDLVPACVLMVALWLMWLTPDFFHRPTTDGERAIHGSLVAINFIGLLVMSALMRRWFDLPRTGDLRMVLGTLYAAKAVLGRSATWRPAHIADLAFAALLTAHGLHDRFEGAGPAVGWFVVASALFAWGAWKRDPAARIMGAIAAIVTVARFWMIDRDVHLALVPALIGPALLYAQSAYLARLHKKTALGDFEGSLIRPLSHIGAAALGLAIWHYPPDLMSGALLALVGVAWLELGRKLKAELLIGEGVAFLAVAACFVTLVNLPAEGRVWGISSRLASTIPVLLGWLCARERSIPKEEIAESVRIGFGLLLFAGLMALLAFELGVSATPVTWALVTGVWALWGRLADRSLEFVTAALGAAATVVMYCVASPLTVPGVGWNGPVYSGAVILAIFAAIHVTSTKAVLAKWPSVARDVVAGMMAVAGFVLLAREMSGTWLTWSWAILGFVLAGYGFAVKDRVCRWASLLVLAVCVGKVTVFDLATFSMPVKIATLLTLGAVMVALSLVYARHHRTIVGYLTGKK